MEFVVLLVLLLVVFVVIFTWTILVQVLLLQMREIELIMLLLHLSVELFILDFLSVFVLLFVVFDNFIQLLYEDFRRDLTLILVLIHAMVCLDLSLQDLELLI